MSQQQAVISIEKLKFEQAGRTILRGVDLVIPRAKIVAIMGPSGCGKTTLLRLIGRQLRPAGGLIKIFEKNIAELSTREMCGMRQRIGMLFQNGALFTHLNVFENVAFPLREHTDLSDDLIRSIVLMKLQAVGLRGAAHLMPAELSGGMVRRVALARAIVLDPEIIMYDEPFTGQDPISKGVLVKLIKTINQILHTTTILVSHDVTETLQIADYVYVLADGEIIGAGTPQQLTEQASPTSSTSPKVQQFIQGLPDGAVPFHYPADPYAADLTGNSQL